MFSTVKRRYNRTVIPPTPTPTATPTPTPTATGTPTPTPTPSPTPVSYDTGSLVFNSGSNNQYLEISDLADVATNADFTVEYYVRFNTLESSAAQTIFMAEPNSGGPVLHLYIDGINNTTKIGRLYIEAGNSATLANASNIQFDTSSWHHIAYVRTNKTGSMYYDGVEKTMTGDTYFNTSLSFGSSTNYIGTTNGTADDLKANLTNFRFVNGTALYTASFTPSSVPLTNVTNTKLLLLTATNAAKYTDTSGNCTIYPNGSPAVAYSIQSPFPFTPIVPTPTPTPTATPTPTPTATPTPTPTPTPTATAAPAPSAVHTLCATTYNPFNRSAGDITTSPASGTCKYQYDPAGTIFRISAAATYFDHWSLNGATFYTGPGGPYNQYSNPCYVVVASTTTSGIVIAHFH